MPFNPTSLITGNGAFYRADMGVTATSTISQWNDQSSFTNNLSSAGGATTLPGYSATGWLGAFPGVTCASGSDNSLAAPSFNFNSTTMTIFMLVDFATQTNGASTQRIAGFGQNGGSETSPNSFYVTGLGTTEKFTGVLGTGATDSQQYSFSLSTAYLLGLVLDGSEIHTFVNGVDQGSPVAYTANIGNSSPGTFIFGEEPAIQGPQAFTCAFMGFTQRALTSTDWTNLITFSNSTFGTSFPGGSSTVNFRRTRSLLGTRAGSRQAAIWR